MASISITRHCDKCNTDVSKPNWARHQQTYHPEDVVEKEVKGERVWCGEHGWISKSQQSRHYKRLHNKSNSGPKESPSDDSRREREATHPPQASLIHKKKKKKGQGKGEEMQSPEHAREAAGLATKVSPALAASSSAILQQYTRDMKAAVRKTRSQIQDQLALLAACPECRLTVELPDYQREITRLQRGEPITYEEYGQMYQAGQLRNLACRRYKYVVCSMEEARTILLFKDLCMPLLVLASPAELGAGRTLSLDSYLAYLSTKETVDVHIYDQAPDEAGQYVQPVSLDAARAVALFRSLSAGPVNFLNLDVYKQNEIPDCLVDLPAYSLLRDLRNHNHSGKPTEKQTNDLSACVAYQICGKAGSFSFPHIDHHGVVNTTRAEEGEKLWVTWPELVDEEFEQWAVNDDLAPAPSAFPIYLRPGDLLIQPPRRVHAPYSITDVLMTGTMHWDSRQMVPMLQQSLYERRYPKITNEDPAMEFGAKLETVEELWYRRAAPWPWPPQRQLEQFRYKMRAVFTICSSSTAWK